MHGFSLQVYQSRSCLGGFHLSNGEHDRVATVPEANLFPFQLFAIGGEAEGGRDGGRDAEGNHAKQVGVLPTVRQQYWYSWLNLVVGMVIVGALSYSQ